MTMSNSRTRAVLGGTLVVGLAIGAFAGAFGIHVGWLLPLAAMIFVVSGVGHLVLAVLLGRGSLKPSRRWGASPVGHLLKAVAWLTIGVLYFARPTAAQVPWYIALLPAVVLLFGFRFEKEAHERASSI